MARHKTHAPRRHLRRKYKELAVEHQRLQRAYRDLEQQREEEFIELLRLQETYEPPPRTSWGAENAALHWYVPPSVERITGELEQWEPPTEPIPVYAVGIDPSSGTSPGGIAVIRSTEDGIAEVIRDPKE